MLMVYGYNNLNKIWEHKTNLWNALSQKLLLLYDCDTKILEAQREKIYKKIVLEYFPSTKTIDTTDIDLEQTINVIINDNKKNI